MAVPARCLTKLRKLTLSSAFLDPNRDITVMEIDQMLRVESAQVTTLNSPK
jgi:hypothetical protein